MFCEECGKQIPDNSKFCDGCGAPVRPLDGQQPLYEEPGYEESGYEEPGYEKTVYEEPEKPAYRAPVYGESDRRGYGGSGYERPRQPYEEPDRRQPYREPGYEKEPKAKKGSAQTVVIILLSVVAVALIAVLIVLGIRVFGGKKNDGAKNDAFVEETESTEAAEETETESPAETESQPEASVPAASLETIPQPETTVPASTEAVSEYILPTSNSAYLTEADLAGLSREELRLARNEIYARHGRKFKDAALNEYFAGKSWYVPLIEPDRFNENVFNDYETANRKLIADYEKKMGY